MLKSAQRRFPVSGSARARGLLVGLLLLLLVSSAQSCSSGDRPDFSGTWALDREQSDFGPVPGPSESVQVIEHDEPVLRLTANSEGFMGENHFEFEFVTDGTDTVQTVDGKTRATETYWDGSVLVTEWEIEDPGQPRFTMVDRRSLSEDGETMTVARQVHSNWADWEQKAVYQRQGPGQDVSAGGSG